MNRRIPLISVLCALLLSLTLFTAPASADHATTLRVAGVGPDYVDLSWVGPEGAYAYDVYKRPAGSARGTPWTHVGQVWWNVTTMRAVVTSGGWDFVVKTSFYGNGIHNHWSNIVRATVGVCAIDPGQGEAAITAAVNSCPNGTAEKPTVVQFPAGKSYTQAHRIEVKDRQHLVIDGNGSTFTTTSNGAVTKSVDPNWLVLRGFGITLRNMTVVGDFTAYEGRPRSLATISPDPEFTEAQMGIGLYGANTVRIEDVKAFNHWGDGVTTGPAHYADPNHVGSDNYTTNVVMDRMTVETVGRMCWGPTSGENITIQNGSCRDAWYGGLDAEADNFTQPLRGHKYLNNTFEGFGNFGIFIPVAGDPGFSKDIEIRGNKFLGPLDRPCNATIGIGGYADSNPRTFENVTVLDNQITYGALGVWLDHVVGGRVAGNTFTQEAPPAGYTWVGWCGYDERVRVTNSTGVTVE